MSVLSAGGFVEYAKHVSTIFRDAILMLSHVHAKNMCMKFVLRNKSKNTQSIDKFQMSSIRVMMHINAANA